ncbi:MAG TPA: vWA domain-containing protein, partial [Terriglobales bacterium]|nr:vWA domain-containing protein [Terriglobales bacterium]HZW92709.1 vWA domain-containing protein [Candidatus Eremiobacteraceae bacterium]
DLAGTSTSAELAAKGTALLASLTMVLLAALLCNYRRGKCLTDIGTEGNADLVIAQERSIIAAAENIPTLRGTITYPHDGTLGIPIAAARIGDWCRPGVDEAFHQLSRGLSALTDQELQRNGLHSIGEEFSSGGSMEEFAAAQSPAVQNHLRWAPHAGTTPLILPARRVVQGIQSMAAATKRGVDVCLLFDISESMGEGNKLADASRGVDAFLQLLQGASSRVCLITFQTQATLVSPLGPNFRSGYPPGSLLAGGRTALLDAVDLGIKTLESRGEQNHIWAIVGFTDGIENASSAREADIVQRLTYSGRIRFYGIAYGSDADFTTLSAMASASDGLVVRGDPGQIKAIYERLSTYV